ncbi:SH3 domain-containing protein [Neobacillus soli]|uniref:SH3 domain-containing protein n=2 Tax=Neobacillus soli TaxID=220688 RepID=UPI001155337D|nr:SH3 domain-containing protein [Neobacillus soli]
MKKYVEICSFVEGFIVGFHFWQIMGDSMKKIGKVALLSTSILLAGGTILPTLPPSRVGHVEAAVLKLANIRYQTTDLVNLRKGAGTAYKSVLKIPKAKTVTASQRMGNWYKVSYQYTQKGKKQTVTGWVSAAYLKEYYQTSSKPGAYYFTKKTVSLYSTADKKKKAVYSLAGGNGLYSASQVVNSIGQTWFKVSYNGKTLFVFSGDVQKYSLSSFSAADYYSNRDTYLYASYGKAYSKLVKIPNGSTISVNQRIGDWYKVTVNGKSGYIYGGDFTKKKVVVPPSSGPGTPPVSDPAPQPGTPAVPGVENPPAPGPENPSVPGSGVETPPSSGPVAPPAPAADKKEVAVTKAPYLVSDQLNFRQDADPVAPILAVIPKGTFVFPTSKVADNSWYKLSYQGKDGYVSGKFIQQVVTGDPIESRDSYQFINLQTQSAVTADQINKYLASYVQSTGKISILTGKGQAFIDAGQKYGVNGLYLAAHAIHESGFGTSAISIAKNNLFGFGAYDAAPFISAYRFGSVEICIDYIAREIKATYLNPANWKYRGAYLGFSTKTLTNTRIDANSEGMNFYYASDVNWGKAIAQHMEKILKYDKGFYAKAKVDSVIPSRPSVPAGSDLFPANITAIAKQAIVLDSKKGVHDAINKISKGASFIILEKTNDFWLRVKVDQKEYWTNNLDFSNYQNYLSVQNLGRVTTGQLNVRSVPSTVNNSPIGSLLLNDLVQIVINKDGSLVMDASKSWYQIQLADGTKAWVSTGFVYTKDFK